MTSVRSTKHGGALTCPDCRGRGKVGIYHTPNRSLNRFHTFRCDRCGGTGLIGAAELERYLAGRKMRQERVDAGKSLREEAARRGISPQELSDIEHGRLR